MRLIGVQVNTVWEDKPASEARVRDLLAETLVQRGDLVVLPEMWATGFSLDVEKIADDTDRDFFMSAEEAKEYGLLDDVITTTAPAPNGQVKK